jgi:hypothetical protein
MAINPANCNLGTGAAAPGANDIGLPNLSGINTPLLTSNLSVNPPLMTNTSLVSGTGNSSTGTMLTQIMSLLFTLIQNMPNASPAASLTGATTTTPLTNTTTLTNTTADAKDKAALNKSLAEINTDPDGAKLMAQAQKLGVTIKVGDPAAAAGNNDVSVKGDGLTDPDNRSVAKDGTVIVNGVTLSDNKTGKITIVVRDPSNIKTIAHELVHAVSTGDGNSKQEEGIADVVGSRIANHLGGTTVGGLSGSDGQIFENKQQFYPTLMSNNDIRDTLTRLGINVSV